MPENMGTNQRRTRWLLDVKKPVTPAELVAILKEENKIDDKEFFLEVTGMW